MRKIDEITLIQKLHEFLDSWGPYTRLEIRILNSDGLVFSKKITSLKEIIDYVLEIEKERWKMEKEKRPEAKSKRRKVVIEGIVIEDEGTVGIGDCPIDFILADDDFGEFLGKRVRVVIEEK